LKLGIKQDFPDLKIVAPHAGAWIETVVRLFVAGLFVVAPHAGAWIETGIEMGYAETRFESRPTRARGLKL